MTKGPILGRTPNITHIMVDMSAGTNVTTVRRRGSGGEDEGEVVVIEEEECSASNVHCGS